MSIMFIGFLFLLVSSVLGRVAVDHKSDELNNILADSTPVKVKTRKSLCTNVIIEDSNGIELCTNVNKVDNGTALIMTRYIKEGRLKEARVASKVDPTHFLGFKSYSGFLTVNDTYNSNLFFWYFPVLNKTENESPWIIWLQGGPGVSSLIGLFNEFGPFSYISGELRENKYTWLQNHSLLFIDNPVGAGYSFTENADGYATDMATYSSHLYTALKQFLQIFPELKTAPLYLAGESYAGKYVPALAMEIHKRRDKSASVANLQGIILGNAFIDPEIVFRMPWSFYYFGLLSKEELQTLKPLIDGFQQDITSNNSVAAKNKWNNLIPFLLSMTHLHHAYNFLRDDITVDEFSALLERSEIKRALHVGDINFNFINTTTNYKLAPDFLSTTKPLIETLLEHYKVLAYCGQLDLMLPCVFSSEHYRTWRWSGSQKFLQALRYPYMYRHRLYGYHKSGGNFTEVVLRGAGHMVPYDVPAPAQNMIAQWTHGNPISKVRRAMPYMLVEALISKNVTIV